MTLFAGRAFLPVQWQAVVESSKSCMTALLLSLASMQAANAADGNVADEVIEAQR